MRRVLLRGVRSTRRLFPARRVPGELGITFVERCVRHVLHSDDRIIAAASTRQGLGARAQGIERGKRGGGVRAARRRRESGGGAEKRQGREEEDGEGEAWHRFFVFFFFIFSFSFLWFFSTFFYFFLVFLLFFFQIGKGRKNKNNKQILNLAAPHTDQEIERSSNSVNLPKIIGNKNLKQKKKKKKKNMKKNSALLLLGASAAWAAPDFSGVRGVLEAYVEHRAFPGAVALVGTANDVIWTDAVGHFTYGRHGAPASGGANPAMTPATAFDLASVTKVSATTTAAMLLYEWGAMGLHDRVTAFLGDRYAQAGKGGIEIVHLLTHSAGYPPDPSPNYWDPGFGCPETAREPHPLENFSCQDKIYDGLLAQTLQYPTGSAYVYSDLSMITMMYVIGTIARSQGYISAAELRPGCDQGGVAAIMCFYEAFVNVHVLSPLGMTESGFLPPQSQWGAIPPTWNDTVYQRRVMQGTVSDGNAYALGGISGHAGLFSTAKDLYTLVSTLMRALDGQDGFLNSTTVRLFTTAHNLTQSSRALGWDTNAPNNDYQGCADMSMSTFCHLGYTGTQICADPEAGVLHIMLTNRVYPSVDNQPLIHAARIAFNTAAVAAVNATTRLGGWKQRGQ
jgi:CubicO group peptidase (beta-lactamase class C family)